MVPLKIGNDLIFPNGTLLRFQIVLPITGILDKIRPAVLFRRTPIEQPGVRVFFLFHSPVVPAGNQADSCSGIGHHGRRWVHYQESGSEPIIPDCTNNLEARCSATICHGLHVCSDFIIPVCTPNQIRFSNLKGDFSVTSMNLGAHRQQIITQRMVVGIDPADTIHKFKLRLIPLLIVVEKRINFLDTDTAQSQYGKLVYITIQCCIVVHLIDGARTEVFASGDIGTEQNAVIRSYVIFRLSRCMLGRSGADILCAIREYVISILHQIFAPI